MQWISLLIDQKLTKGIFVWPCLDYMVNLWKAKYFCWYDLWALEVIVKTIVSLRESKSSLEVARLPRNFQ